LGRVARGHGELQIRQGLDAVKLAIRSIELLGDGRERLRGASTPAAG
jgi:hypothetical protein